LPLVSSAADNVELRNNSLFIVAMDLTFLLFLISNEAIADRELFDTSQQTHGCPVECSHGSVVCLASLFIVAIVSLSWCSGDYIFITCICIILHLFILQIYIYIV